MTPDSQLLDTFARTRSEGDFAELVRRHVNLVYSAAVRQVNGDAHLAEDVAQTVFIDLARKAKTLAGRESVTGWLYTSAHFAAAKVVRGEARRRQREERFMSEPIQENAPAAEWDTLRPLLDEAMHDLKEPDREAVLLRYFENRPFAEVGARLGLNENAARMRVERALEKLRAVLAKRGVTATAGLAAALSANAVQMAPARLATALTAGSVATAGTSTMVLLKIMTATQIKLGLGAMVVAGATTALVLQHQTQTRLRDENESLTREIAQLKTDYAGWSNRLSASVAAASPAPRNNQLDELLRLRGQVAVLSQQKAALERGRADTSQVQARLRATAPVAASSLPDDYPKTADGAAKSMFEMLGRGDMDSLTNFDIEGGPEALGNITNYLHGVQIVSLGQPTNSFGPNLWFVPYTIQFPDGTQKTFRLHVGQDPASQRWILKGGI
jgi:RNA polymerase sigma factor (sigma-70 family)